MSYMTEMQAAINMLIKEVNAIKTNAKQVHEFDYIVFPLNDTDYIHIDRNGVSKKIKATDLGAGGIPTGASWGSISGDIDNQIDLKIKLEGLEPSLGNPPTDGFALFSTASGHRYWQAVSTGGGGDTDSITNSSNVPGTTATDAFNNIWSTLNPPKLNSFTVNGASIFKAGTTLVSPTLAWSGVNGIGSSTTWDSDNTTTPISTSYKDADSVSSNRDYVKSYGHVTWTIHVANTGDKSVTKYWVYPSHWGKKTSNDMPTEAEIIASNDLIIRTESRITIKPNNLPTEHIWFAIPVTGSAFTKWFNVVGNDGLIGSGEAFELRTSTMEIDGKMYEIYTQTLPSAWSGNLKLF